MAAGSEALQRELADIFGDRVRFDRLERKLYSHDIGEMPPLVRPLVDAGLAGAVVRPADEAELVRLVKWASERRVPLVPRGASTSGYGGVLPVEGAVVVDMLNFSSLVSIGGQRRDGAVLSGAEGDMAPSTAGDESEDETRFGGSASIATATFGTGSVWENVERALAKSGLALRLYPSSAPSSTVGGWLAQGGAGFGSYEYGYFAENVVSARVVLPSGEVRDFAGAELAKIAGAEGTTGIVTQVTFAVRPLQEEVVRGYAFESARELSVALKAIRFDELPIWSLTFINPENVRLKSQVPLRVHAGHEVGEHVDLPEAYVMLAVYPASRREAVEGRLESMALAAGGARIADEDARREWDERFNPMKVKRIGPSMVPMEVVVPSENLAKVVEELDAAIKQPLVLEGMVGKSDEVVLLGFIPHDSSRFGFNLAFGLTLTAFKIAEANGGRVYSTGLYFRHKAEQVLGGRGVARYLEAKRELDPNGVMNPGKVVGNGTLGKMMNAASRFEPLVRALGNRAGAPIGGNGGNGRGLGKGRIPDDVAYYANACAQCGYCVRSCDQFYGRGWESDSPRGKFYYLREVLAGREKFEQADVNRFMVCTTCETCSVRCQLNMPVEESWMELRGQLIHKEGRMTFPPFEMMGAALEAEGNIWARYREGRDDWVPEDLRPKIKPKAGVAYFAGCTASYVEKDIAEASLRLLDAAGVEFTTMGKDENCCGIPMLVAGKWDLWEENMRRNIEKMKETGAKTVVASCPACHMVWAQLYKEWADKLGIEYDFEVKHYSEIAADKIASRELEFTHEVPAKVTFHDSCHIGRASGVYEPPRELIKAIPGVELVEMEHNREEGLCCGSVLTLVGERPVAAGIGNVRLDEAVEAGAESVVALCPCCQVQLRVTSKQRDKEIPVHDLARLAMLGLGYEIPDSTEVALEAWGPFERFIDLMQPKAMADLMEAVFEPMFAAMPKPLGLMMDLMKKIPGGLRLMKPMMPLMLPMLVPILMPKVMPEMLAEVEKRTGPLPDFIVEQMPDLLPKTMDALMPNMLPLMTPYVVPKMLDYMKNGKPAKTAGQPA
ncbi:MAG: FAD-binding oxidoreductase [Actinobacteria bacterium]|nr:MAG: FAD-binding oxidoreductase [Actinomycetota bacterium]